MSTATRPDFRNPARPAQVFVKTGERRGNFFATAAKAELRLSPGTGQISLDDFKLLEEP